MKKTMDLIAISLLIGSFMAGAFATAKVCAQTQSSVHSIVTQK